MNTIAIIGQKGGTGKTTVAVALAVTAARAGETVVILDLDPQTNAEGWANRREDDNPTVVAVRPGRLRQAVEAAQAGGADLILIDTPGKNDTAATEAAKLADLALIPSRPLIFDMDTLTATRNIIRAAGDPPAYVVYNCVHPQGHALIEKLKAMTPEAYGLRASPAHITQRAIFPESQAQGKGPQELHSDSRASIELEELYLFVTKAAKQGKKNGKQKPFVA